MFEILLNDEAIQTGRKKEGEEEKDRGYDEDNEEDEEVELKGKIIPETHKAAQI